MAIRDARIIGRALKVAFALEEAMVDEPAAAAAAVERLVAEKGVRFVLVDLPAPATAELARATAGRDIVLLNVSAREDALRGEFCALAPAPRDPERGHARRRAGQYAATMRWHEILLLVGPSAADEALGLGLRRGHPALRREIVEPAALSRPTTRVSASRTTSGY